MANSANGAAPATLFDKIWAMHAIRELGEGVSLLHVDRHLLHDLEGGPRLADLRASGRTVARPDLTFATPDHAMSSAPDRTTDTYAPGGRLVRSLRRGTAWAGIRLFDLDSPAQGIVHVVGPEQGLTQPGMTIACGDSHTSTHGAFGSIAFGIGTSQVADVLATQTLALSRPKVRRVEEVEALKYYFRVRALGAAGPGPWSDPATKIVP